MRGRLGEFDGGRFFAPTAALLLAVAGLLAYLLWSGYQEALRGAEIGARNLAWTLEARFQASLNHAKVTLDQLAAGLPPDVLRPQAVPYDEATINARLDRELMQFPELSGLHIADADGDLLYTSDSAITPRVNVGDRPHFQRLRSDPSARVSYSDVFASRLSGKPTVVLSRALRDGDGRFLGTLAAMLDLKYFEDLMGAIDVGDRGVIAIRRSDDFKLVLRWPPMPEEVNGVLPAAHPIRRAVADGVRRTTVQAAAHTDRVERIFAVHALEQDPYYVLVGVARDDVLEGWRLRAVGVLAGGFVLLASLALQRRRITRIRRQEWEVRRRLADEKRQLHLSEAKLAEAMDMAGMAGWEYDVDSGMFAFDDRFYAVCRTTAAQVGGYGLAAADYAARFLHADDAYKVGADIARCLAGADAAQVLVNEGRVRCGDGAVRWMAVHFRYVPPAGGGGARIAGVVIDIDERKCAEEQAHLFAQVFEHSGEAIVVTDADNRIMHVNRSFSRLTGYDFGDVVGANPSVLSAGRTTAEEYAAMWQIIREQGHWQGEIWDRRKDGHCYPKWLTISTLRDVAGKVTHHVGSFTDISEQKAAEQQIRHLAHHDALTGLPNRFSLRNRLEQAVAAAQRGGRQLAVMFIDLDHFKRINDTLGHPAGDALLIEVAARLRGCVRESDVVARLGGDEFVIVMTDVADGNVQSIPAMARKVIDRLSSAYRVQGHELHVTPSVGIGVFPADGADADALMKNADTAMYHAKSRGRQNFQFFTAAMNEAAAERLQLENALRQAVERNEFVLHYQPQFEVASGRVVGLEALVRWRHPTLGLVPPDKFIPLAEETGLIEPLGRWVLDEACRQVQALARQGHPGLRMAVNLSPRQLRREDIVACVEQLLRVHGMSSGQLELEITESVTMETPELTAAILSRFRDLGVILAIDDFGTGYSSLSRLKVLPIQRIKLDRSFVRDLETDPNDAAIIRASIAMAHSLGLAVVAEGVETEMQLAYLRELGCDDAQGFYLSRPLPADALLVRLAGQRGTAEAAAEAAP